MILRPERSSLVMTPSVKFQFWTRISQASSHSKTQNLFHIKVKIRLKSLSGGLMEVMVNTAARLVQNPSSLMIRIAMKMLWLTSTMSQRAMSSLLRVVKLRKRWRFLFPPKKMKKLRKRQPMEMKTKKYIKNSKFFWQMQPHKVSRFLPRILALSSWEKVVKKLTSRNSIRKWLCTLLLSKILPMAPSSGKR